MKKKHSVRWGIFIFVFLTAISCNKTKENVEVIAQAGDAVLTKEDLVQMVPKFDSLNLSKEQIENFIKRWVEREVIYQEAIRTDFIKNAKLQRELNDIAKDYIVAQFIDQNINKGISVSEREIENYYHENADEFKSFQDEYHVKLILVATYNEASEIRKLIKGKEDFAKLAKQRSLDGSRLNGGDLGFVTLDRLSPMLARVVVKLTKGELSSPIKSEVGYNLIYLEDRRAKGSLLPLEQVKFIIKERLMETKRAENYHQFLTSLFEKANVKTDYSSLGLQ